MTGKTIRLDVREDIRRGGNPFSKIMDALAQLSADENLLVTAPFEPVPLIRALEKRGFGHKVTRLGSGDWEALFFHSTESSGTPPSDEPPQGIPRSGSDTELESRLRNPSTILEVDARGLEPPQPMVLILEALATLPPDSVLQARTDRRPLHLYPQLELRGFNGETNTEQDGSFVTLIRRHPKQ